MMGNKRGWHRGGIPSTTSTTYDITTTLSWYKLVPHYHYPFGRGVSFFRREGVKRSNDVIVTFTPLLFEFAVISPHMIPHDDPAVFFCRFSAGGDGDKVSSSSLVEEGLPLVLLISAALG